MPERRRRCGAALKVRIVAGEWRGRTLVTPPGQGTRPTADRVRQALFDTLMHAEWGGRALIGGAVVLDAFAGTGALGLEALSRGAAAACFFENDPLALRALRANVAAFTTQRLIEIAAEDVLAIRPSRADADKAEASRGAGQTGAASLVFLDPPYGQGLVPRAIARLMQAGRIAPNALIVAETGRRESWLPEQPLLAERHYGAARIMIFRGA